MPAQDLGVKNEKVRVIAVNSLTGEVISNSLQLSQSEGSSTGDSVDGSLTEYLTTRPKGQVTTRTLAAENNGASLAADVQMARNLNDSTGTSDIVLGSGDTLRTTGTNNIVLSSGDTSRTTLIQTSGSNQVTSGGAVTIPQVIIVDTKESASSLLGKRPGENLAQNSLVNYSKIVITKNPNSSQSQVVPVHVHTLPQSSSLQQGTSSSTQAPRTPTKTITISQQGIISPMKGVTMTQVVGTPPKLPISKLPMSPAKTSAKITMIPVQGRSPQRIAPAGLGHNFANNTNTSTVPPTITMSPSKVMKQPTVHVIQKPIQPSPSSATVLAVSGPGTSSSTQGVRQVTLPTNLQQIHVTGNKFHYIRLPTSSAGARAQLIPVSVPSSIGTPGQLGQPVKITLPPQSTNQITGTRPGGSGVQRIILPAGTNQVAIRPAPPASGTQIIQTTLPAGSGTLAQIAPSGTATFIPAGANTVNQGLQGFALVPASYLSQIQQQIQVKPAVTTAPLAPAISTETSSKQIKSEYVPIASNNPAVSANTQSKNNSGSTDASGGARQRKPCNCTKSQCLKLYCDCFANGEFCHNCNCHNCANNLEHEEDRSRAIKACLDRNPLAFHPKIGKGRAGEKDRRHNKGCNCKRSGCLKNYCECYEAKIMCSSSCKCIGCKNFEESPERKTLMHLADAAEVRVQQQTAAKSKLSSQISDVPSRPVSSVTGERLPFSFVTSEVVEATCACLLAQAEEAERLKMPPVVQERNVIEEFGRCLVQIIESANRTKAPDPDDTG